MSTDLVPLLIRIPVLVGIVALTFLLVRLLLARYLLPIVARRRPAWPPIVERRHLCAG